ELSKSNDVVVGAGTVRNLAQAKRALDAGAKFLVSPGLNEDVLGFSETKDLLYLPGVLTPTEIMRATELGSEVVKIFPAASVGGAEYLRALSGPFPEVKWVATGGIKIEDTRDYMRAGAFAIGLGSQLAPKEAIHSKNWKEITRIAKQCVTTVGGSR
ncbi:MAG: bifunctional 4-hydroxy-2-oxoglutarate aldolase/2-dehydro-3-deoxy-phosphogluconate aldolase, partial [Bdellovibrionota bacterium]